MNLVIFIIIFMNCGFYFCMALEIFTDHQFAFLFCFCYLMHGSVMKSEILFEFNFFMAKTCNQKETLVCSCMNINQKFCQRIWNGPEFALCLLVM